MPTVRHRDRADVRVVLPAVAGAFFTTLALVGGDGPGGAPTGWYAAFFGLTTVLVAPALLRRRWPERLGLVLGGLLQFLAGLWLMLAGVGLVLMAAGALALWAAARPRRSARP